jgi:hypothetical protein
MEEQVVATIRVIRRNEAEAAIIVNRLDTTGRHHACPFL